MHFAPNAGRDTLRIALVNNMSDVGLRSAERQFCTLLASASEGLTVELDLYTLPQITRGYGARAHIASHYNDLAVLEERVPDGMIVTGFEPRERCLEQERFWPGFLALHEYTRRHATPVIWSCLAAHAAVLCEGGPGRTKLHSKLFGVFDSTVRPGAHDVLRGLPRQLCMPQSRLHSLPEKGLLDSGYEILVHSRKTGPDIFMVRLPALQLFVQGHPEYRGTTLPAQYRRDARRFVLGETNDFPAAPPMCFPILSAASWFAGLTARTAKTVRHCWPSLTACSKPSRHPSVGQPAPAGSTVIGSLISAKCHATKQRHHTRPHHSDAPATCALLNPLRMLDEL